MSRVANEAGEIYMYIALYQAGSCSYFMFHLQIVSFSHITIVLPLNENPAQWNLFAKSPEQTKTMPRTLKAKTVVTATTRYSSLGELLHFCHRIIVIFRNLSQRFKNVV